MPAGTLSLRRLAAILAAMMLLLAFAITPVAAGDDDDDDDNGDNGDNGGVPDTAMMVGAGPNLALIALGATSLVTAAGVRYVLRRED